MFEVRMCLNRDKLFEVEDGTFSKCRQDRALDQGGLRDLSLMTSRLQ